MGSEALADGGTRINHGCYAVDSKFDVEQHGYAGGEGGYVELLEIKNGPDDRSPVFVVQYGIGTGYRIFTFENMKAARKMWPEDSPWPPNYNLPGKFEFAEIPIGSSPWFYAKQDQEIDGDLVVKTAD